MGNPRWCLYGGTQLRLSSWPSGITPRNRSEVIQVPSKIATRLEIVVQTVDDAVLAQECGANRVEVCQNIGQGGVSPSLEVLGSILDSISIPARVMVRPRPGDFVYSESDKATMLAYATKSLELGAEGIVFGALMPDCTIDYNFLTQIVQESGPHPVTFHRAFDECTESVEAVRRLADAGCQAILSSGRESTAVQGTDTLIAMNSLAAGAIDIIVAGKVRAACAARLIGRIRPAWIHAAPFVAGVAGFLTLDGDEIRSLAEIAHGNPLR